MKIWKRYDPRPLNRDQEAERLKLKLDTAGYKLYDFIRASGSEGVAWGSLPSYTSHRLVEGGLVTFYSMCNCVKVR